MHIEEQSCQISFQSDLKTWAFLKRSPQKQDDDDE